MPDPTQAHLFWPLELCLEKGLPCGWSVLAQPSAPCSIAPAEALGTASEQAYPAWVYMATCRVAEGVSRQEGTCPSFKLFAEKHIGQSILRDCTGVGVEVQSRGMSQQVLGLSLLSGI